MKTHFSEAKIVEITLMNALENCYNLMNRPLGIGSHGLCELVAQGRGAAAASR